MPTVITRGGMAAKAVGFTSGQKTLTPGTVGIFAIGFSTCIGLPSTTRNKYTFACDVNGSATSASSASSAGSAAGNSTKGIFALGFNSSCS